MGKNRIVPLVEGEAYHIFSKSIYGFKVFRRNEEYERMADLFRYYKKTNLRLKFSAFLKIKGQKDFHQGCLVERGDLVEIIAYCIMPTHIHLILKQVKERGVSIFMSRILNSYTRYFNIKINRKGPLWESRFKNVILENDEQMMHLTRYVHLNPVTANLVNKPEQWKFSSYKEFLGEMKDRERICNFSSLINIGSTNYREFTESRIDYQRELARIKSLFLE